MKRKKPAILSGMQGERKKNEGKNIMNFIRYC